MAYSLVDGHLSYFYLLVIMIEERFCIQINVENDASSVSLMEIHNVP